MLQRFIDSFSRAVTGEMESMRRRMGPYEIQVTEGMALDQEAEQQRFLYGFRVLQPNDKLVQGGECNLVTETADELVSVVSIDGDRIVLASMRPVDLLNGGAMLVIYPWFLYEKLLASLRSLGESDSFHTDTALALFGKQPARRLPAGAVADLPASLNHSQRQAVELCRQVTPAFVWGPPGTGKTTTLGHIILCLLQLGQRVLVTSTTNAAVDQALASFANLEDGKATIDSDTVVRLGQTQADTCGAGLREVVDRLHADLRDRLLRLDARRDHILQQLARGKLLLDDLSTTVHDGQLGLFEADTPVEVDPQRLTVLFGASNAARLALCGLAQQQAAVEQRLARLERAARLCVETRQMLQSRLRQQQSVVVAEARLVLATMTNVYMSSLLEGQRFDAVIVEEAGMAILPTLFYCACLGAQRAIMVGDPQQLPPIVQSNDPFVQRAMGRGIFQVTVPEPHVSDLVVMLDTQYRMHPDIGDLVGELFYKGRLQHGANTRQTATIAAGVPCAGAAIVVADTAGSADCQTPSGSYSRFNERHARIAVEFARQSVEGGADSIAIITPYVEQVRRIGRLLADAPGLADHVECRTVHRFQGGERDVVIFDTVDADPLPPGRLLSGKAAGSSAPNLINVSLSRARGKLLIIADVSYFRRHDPSGVISQVLAAASRAGTVMTP
jgi:anion-transporting  ArsA/GET3 family ATPase